MAQFVIGFLPFSLHLVVAHLILSSGLTTCSAARTHPLEKSSTGSTEFIRTSCEATTYPRVCFNSLSAYASTIQTSPRQMALAALSVTLFGARSTSDALLKMSAQGLKMKPREKAAMTDCLANLSDSVDEIRRSTGEMGHLSGPNFDLKLNDIQTWVSAALTDEDTCMDGFEGMTGKVRTAVRGKIVKVAQLTSNALALVNGLAASAP
ncbi:21 kDa protein-like [Aristolochia californica]|uniref:21 kDa protein-like n=1 Tax=Aristolochia californica TaxID=171875 RepID=UPI0035D9F810